MKLFTRTLLLLILLIIFQSGLTIGVVVSLMRQNNNDDIVESLHTESRIFYDDFNSWKSAIWKKIIFFRNAPEPASLLRILDSSQDFAAVEAYFSDTLRSSGFDMIFLKSEEGNFFHSIALSETRIALEESMMVIRREHPAVRLMIDNNVIYLVGEFEIGSTDLFLVKKANRTFCLQMSTDYHSDLLFFNNGAYITGSLNNDEIIDSIKVEAPDVAYSRLKVDDAVVTVQKVGKIETNDEGSDLLLVTYLSTLPFQQYLVSVERILFSVTMLGALLSVLLSFFISRNMTKPLLDLTLAMKKIQNGDYTTSLNYMSINEIGSLVSGFNEMAGHLYNDKIEMNKYIDEITYLRDYNETVVQSIRVGLAIINDDYAVEKANNAFFQLLGLSDDGGFPKLDDCEVVTEEISQAIRNIIEGGADYFSRIVRSDADLSRVFDIKLYPFRRCEEGGGVSIGCILLVDDISRKSELDEKIFLAEKLSTISLLSAGVAHEINNPLSSILSNVQNVISADLDDELKENVRWIEQETLRIAQIVRNLLDFSSPGGRDGKLASANQIIDQVLNLMSYTAGYRITIKKDLQHNLPPALISNDELKQVIINLVLNAIQAMPGGGEICMTTGFLPDDGNILIIIEDTGPGIAEKNIKRIFDPFFTTKDNGEGTGLGLSVVYGIITKYNGNIDVKSTPGKGTAVHLNIPAIGKQYD